MASRRLMSNKNRAEDVKFALNRAKKKINNLQRQLNKETSPERTSPTWTPSKELRDSLVDMYRDNPGVKEELRQRLPSPPPLRGPDRSRISQGPQSVPPVSPLSHRRSVSPSTFTPPGGKRLMELDLPPQPESCGSVSDGGGASRGPGSPVLRRPPVSSDDSFHRDVMFGPITASDPLQTSERDKNISLLLTELESLRETNKKLQKELIQKEKELQRRAVEEELREELREARSWERPAALLEEVLAAQKDRDRAVMSRLLLANKERDEAFIRARQVQLAAEHLDVSLEDPDEDTAEAQDMDQLLCCVCDADSVQKVQRFGSVLVQHLRLARQRRNEITTQEMMAVMKERDSAIAKCKQLEQDVMEERKEHARETELLRRKDIDVELQVLQAPRSFQDLHAPLPSDGGSPLALVQQLSNEKENMGAELQRCREAEREASEKVLKLERLVEVLRKKVGTGSLRAVM